MKNRKISATDLEVSPIVFGGNVFGWTLDSYESFQILNNFIERGFNFIDTANNYSYWKPGNDGGESERILGEWMHRSKNRQEIIIATKVGGRGIHFDKPNSTKKHILEQTDQSLIRLKTDYIDLLQLHYDDGVTEVEETLSAFQDLITLGKVRWAGASNITPERLEESLKASGNHGLPKYQSLQPLYNIYERESFEKSYKDLAEKYNLSVLTYYSLASGFLTGKYRNEQDFSKSARGEGIKKYLNERGFAILKELDEIAYKYQTTPTAISLAWLMHQPQVFAPIASATKIEHLNAFSDAVRIEFNQEDLEKLNEASKY